MNIVGFSVRFLKKRIERNYRVGAKSPLAKTLTLHLFFLPNLEPIDQIKLQSGRHQAQHDILMQKALT